MTDKIKVYYPIISTDLGWETGKAEPIQFGVGEFEISKEYLKKYSLSYLIEEFAIPYER